MAAYKNHEELSRIEIQAAIAKAVELRALHAALVQGSSPAAAAAGSNLRFNASSPVSRPPAPSQLSSSAQDYPVFTPSYEDEAGVPSYQKSRAASETWEDYDLGGGGGGGGSGNDVILSDYKKGLLTLVNAGDDQKSTAGSCTTNHITVLQTSPKSCRSATLGDFKVTGSDNASRISKNSNIVVPLTDSHASTHSHPKPKGTSISRWFAKIKNKNKNDSRNWSPGRAESEDVRDFGGAFSIESLRRELAEANENRDAALAEAADMRSSLGELKGKLEHLETYCEDLKNALRQQTTRARSKSTDLNSNSMPVSSEAMTEGFLQIVSEARLSVKQFCKTLLGQIEECSDTALTDNINLILSPYKLAVTSKLTKPVLYHLEAIINQSLYQDFENSAFCKNGAPRFLDPNQERQAQFASFVALRNLSWNEVLRKGTKYYSEEFSKFCDQKMSCVIATLSWTRPWPEQLLQAFFVAAKCVWLVHLLAFSFRPSLGILRVEEGRVFDGSYMEDVFGDKQKLSGRVKVMVVPGFYVQDRVLRCKVVCRYKSVS